MNGEYCVITTAVNERDFAHELARKLVDSRLAACVQVVPIESTYRWKGEVTTDSKYLLMIKTLSSLYIQVEEAIREVHPYEVPEVLRSPLEGGFAQYLEWVKDSVK